MVTKQIESEQQNSEYEKKVKCFRGNIVFASLETMNFKVPTFKDDLISLCYLTLAMLNNGEPPFIDEVLTFHA